MGQKFIYMTRLPLRNGFGWPYFFFRFFSRLRMKSLAHVQFFGVETIRCEKSPVLSFLKSVVLIFLHAVNTNRVQACLFLFSIRCHNCSFWKSEKTPKMFEKFIQNHPYMTIWKKTPKKFVKFHSKPHLYDHLEKIPKKL